MGLSDRIEWFETVDSTNAEALRRSAAGECGPLWIAARAQTAGRGRRGRKWESKTGNLAASLLLHPRAFRPSATHLEVATLSYAAALSVADMIGELGILSRPRMKWPNDVLVAGAKIAGILIEARGDAAVIGIGVNIMSAPPVEAMDPVSWPQVGATSLCAFLAETPLLQPEAVLQTLTQCFEVRFEQWRFGGFAALREDWLERAEHLSQNVIARLPNETVEGRFSDIDADGALLLWTEAGLRRIHAADVYPAAIKS